MGPDLFAGGGVEAIEHAAATERMNLAAVERGCCSRASTGDRFLKTGLVFVRPKLFAGGEVDADNGFGLAALFLSKGAVANNSERRPAWPDTAAPKLARRFGVPVGAEADMVHVGVAVRSTKSGPVGIGGNEVGGWFGRCGGRRLLTALF